MLTVIARIMGSLAAVVTATIGVVMLALSGLLSVELFRYSDAWYFPGDPAWAEFGVEVGAISLACTSLFLLIAWSMGWTRHRWLRAPARIAVVLSAATLLVPLACIAQRHFGEWAKLRALVWQLAEHAESEGRGVQVFEPPIEFRFAGRAEPARIRSVGTGRWPGVLIDFGNGGNAGFDLRTMWCDYSD